MPLIIEKVIDYDENYCFIYNRKVTDKEVEFYYLSLLNMSYAAIPDDCVLYKLVRAVNGKVSLKEEYDFSEYNDYLADFTKHGVRMVYKNNFYFRGYIYEDSVVYYQERPRWFVLETVNGKKSVRIIKEAEYYTLDCFSEENILKAELSKGQECDGYIYYKIDDYLGSYESLHNFRRYNIATGKVDIMQCWNSSWDEEYDYAAEELWEQKLDWCVRSY